MVSQKLDTENANSKIVAYFDSMTSEQICLTVEAFQTSIVSDDAGLLKGLIEVIDYYSPGEKSCLILPITLSFNNFICPTEKKAEVFYEIPDDLSRCS